MQQNPLTLDEVKSHFDHWRTTRTKKRERIPMSLWEEVGMLIGYYSLSDITKTLSINTGQIKDNIKLETKIDFVEVKNKPLSIQHQQITTPFLDYKQICSIELSRVNGTTLKIGLLPIEALQKIISQFME
jgi:hypothetical protein